MCSCFCAPSSQKMLFMSSVHRVYVCVCNYFCTPSNQKMFFRVFSVHHVYLCVCSCFGAPSSQKILFMSVLCTVYMYVCAVVLAQRLARKCFSCLLSSVHRVCLCVCSCFGAPSNQKMFFVSFLYAVYMCVCAVVGCGCR